MARPFGRGTGHGGPGRAGCVVCDETGKRTLVRFFFPDTPELPLPAGHRFPAGKYRLLRQLVEREEIISASELFPSPPASQADLERAHDPGYVAAAFGGTLEPAIERRIGLPWSEILLARSRATVGGALAAARSALRDGLSGQLAGGTHHAHREFGSGYCVFNDLAVSTLTLLADKTVQRVAILDLDVHQGDGNASILASRSDVLVISLHGEKNFPFRKVASHIDVGLPDETNDRSYLHALADVLPAIEAFRPDLLLYLSGSDPLATDTLGRLALSMDGLAERDRLVFQLCHRRNIPVSIAIGGGYANPITDSVRGYANTFRMAREVMGT